MLNSSYEDRQTVKLTSFIPLTQESSRPARKCSDFHQQAAGVIGAARFLETARAGSWKTSTDPAHGHSDRDGRTTDRLGSDAPPRTGDAATGCQSNRRPAAFGSAVRDRPREGLYGFRNRQDGRKCCSSRQTDQSTATGGLGGHDPRAKTRRTKPPALPASVPSSPFHPPVRRIESAKHASIEHDFYNKIRPKYRMLRGLGLAGMSLEVIDAVQVNVTGSFRLRSTDSEKTSGRA